MKRWIFLVLSLLVVLGVAFKEITDMPARPATSGGWVKSEHNPVLGGALGTCFDVALLKDEGVFRMWFSWRPKQGVALVESADGIHWSEPDMVLGPDSTSGWEDAVNRPVVVKRSDGYHMWYTGQKRHFSRIGYATSADGRVWTRMGGGPVLSPENPWEKVAVMCPHVLWDEQSRLFKMWYSGGEQYEPNAIGYATSLDGVHWAKNPDPVFTPSSENDWDAHKVTACQVVPYKDGYLMFYIGFRDEHHAQIGLAWSQNGVSGWQRHPANPLIRPGNGFFAWDRDAVYKPYAILDKGRWLLWYNGRKGKVEQIGLAIHEGEDLGLGFATGWK
jgi:beta-1,2-mannobiose phosphorylase / 1,2-beta-oligomannan phosphorylase